MRSGIRSVIQRVRARYLDLPGIAGNYASTPDSVANSVTGDLDVRVKVAFADWTPGAIKFFLGKYVPTGNQRSWLMLISATGVPGIFHSADGTATATRTATAAVGAADGSVKWLRFTLDVDNGAGGSTVVFYTSDDGVTWAQLGAPHVAAGVVAVFDSTAPITAGGYPSQPTSEMVAGNLYYAEIRNGIDGTVVACFDAADALLGQTSFLSSRTTETWTINTSGGTPARLVRQVT